MFIILCLQMSSLCSFLYSQMSSLSSIAIKLWFKPRS
jgi:hypothetical protein